METPPKRVKTGSLEASLDQELEGKIEEDGPEMDAKDVKDIVQGVVLGVLGEGRQFGSSKDYLKYLAHARAAMEGEDSEDVYLGYSQVQAQAVEDARWYKESVGWGVPAEILQPVDAKNMTPVPVLDAPSGSSASQTWTRVPDMDVVHIPGSMTSHVQVMDTDCCKEVKDQLMKNAQKIVKDASHAVQNASF